MERVQVLIEKLQQQKQQNESIAQMLITVQLLQNELQTLQQNTKVLGTSKVAVVLPASPKVQPPVSYKAEEAPIYKEEKPLVQEIKQVEVASEVKPTPAPVEQEAPRPAQREEYRIQKPVVPEPEPVHAIHSSIYDKHFEVQEAPTLIQQQIHKEINELRSHPKESLNDKLKQSKKEVAHALKETPIKDLRKAIGVNDKFTFINELFRGDEAMYERSIKTINGFHILPEAEYWMNRELKVKLGWNDNKEIVQHFYQLVRRRFSCI